MNAAQWRAAKFPVSNEFNESLHTGQSAGTAKAKNSVKPAPSMVETQFPTSCLGSSQRKWSCLSNNPVLHDTNHEDYMRAKLKDDIWRKIDQELKYANGEFSSEQALTWGQK
jgi:hypothetical protein